MIRILFCIFLLIPFSVQAAPIVYGTTYASNGTVTSANLNGNFTNVSSIVNGGLDNTNANTTNGYRFYQTVAVLPSPGNQGSVYFLTSDNSLNFDTGTSFSKSLSVISPSANQYPVYNGSSWVPTNISTSATGLVPSGVIVMWSGTIATIPSGWTLCNGNNSTPDLRNLFVVGADTDSGGVAKSTITGSALQSGGSTTITTGNLPASPLTISGSTSNGSSNTTIQFTTNGGTLSTMSTSNLGTAAVYTQPFYALAYIMKT